MLEKIGAVSIILGLIFWIIGFMWLIVRLFKTWLRKTPWSRLRAPVVLILVSSLMAGMPIAINSALIRLIPLGPLETIVDGEQHITLTGWDRNDYSVIARKNETVVLQMANADVSDDTLRHLSGMTKLRELDLNNSQVTDAGLAIIAALPALCDLRLARTKITDEGFRQHLFAKPGLMKLELTGTAVASKTLREWKAVNPERQALK